MKTSPRTLHARLASLLMPAVLAGCMSSVATSTSPAAGPAAGGGGGTSDTPAAAPANPAPGNAAPAADPGTAAAGTGLRAEARPGDVLQRDITLRVDPQAGTLTAIDSREALAVIQTQLALDFDAVNLVQNGDTTSFMLQVTNRGSDVVDLSLAFGGDRPVISPSGKVDVGAMPAGANAQQALSFNNPGGGAFTVKVSLWAMLQAQGDVASNGTAVTPTATPSTAATPTPAPTATPASTAPVSPAPTPAPTPTPTPASPAPTPTPVATPTGATSPAPSPLATANPTPPPPTIANPGPGAIAGRILMNGKSPFRSFSLTLVLTQNGSWSSSQSITSDAQGNFSASNLAAGDYLVYFYNDSMRDVIGYWRSRALHVDATTGAAFPVIDFYQTGLQNVPAMDSHVTLPTTFQWIPQTQTVGFYHWRLHSTSGRTFQLIYQSPDKLDGTATSYTWDGAGVTLSPTNRYFWGVSWDAGPAGEGGNLYQAIYFNQ